MPIGDPRVELRGQSRPDIGRFWAKFDRPTLPPWNRSSRVSPRSTDSGRRSTELGQVVRTRALKARVPAMPRCSGALISAVRAEFEGREPI